MDRCDGGTWEMKGKTTLVLKWSKWPAATLRSSDRRTFECAEYPFQVRINPQGLVGFGLPDVDTVTHTRVVCSFQSARPWKLHQATLSELHQVLPKLCHSMAVCARISELCNIAVQPDRQLDSE